MTKPRSKEPARGPGVSTREYNLSFYFNPNKNSRILTTNIISTLEPIPSSSIPTSSILYFDTFNGTGLLSAHIANVGFGTWITWLGGLNTEEPTVSGLAAHFLSNDQYQSASAVCGNEVLYTTEETGSWEMFTDVRVNAPPTTSGSTPISSEFAPEFVLAANIPAGVWNYATRGYASGTFMHLKAEPTSSANWSGSIISASTEIATFEILRWVQATSSFGPSGTGSFTSSFTSGSNSSSLRIGMERSASGEIRPFSESVGGGIRHYCPLLTGTGLTTTASFGYFGMGTFMNSSASIIMELPQGEGEILFSNFTVRASASAASTE